MIKDKITELNYYKYNAEEDYMEVPISVLRYITKLETIVNSKLTAAAPDLLESLQIAVKKQGYFSDKELIQARKAIEKALK